MTKSTPKTKTKEKIATVKAWAVVNEFTICNHRKYSEGMDVYRNRYSARLNANGCSTDRVVRVTIRYTIPLTKKK